MGAETNTDGSLWKCGIMKALDTVYRHYRFRSRTEARWAIFFDLMQIPFVYEKEGFDLNGMYYLPDFWLPHQKVWAEVKSLDPTPEEIEKAIRLSALTQSPVVFLIFATDIASTIEWSGGFYYLPGKPEREKYVAEWHVCPKCDAPNICPAAFCAGFDCWKCKVRLSPEEVCAIADAGMEMVFVRRITESYQAAMQARFEHGENPERMIRLL